MKTLVVVLLFLTGCGIPTTLPAIHTTTKVSLEKLSVSIQGTNSSGEICITNLYSRPLGKVLCFFPSTNEVLVTNTTYLWYQVTNNGAPFKLQASSDLKNWTTLTSGIGTNKCPLCLFVDIVTNKGNSGRFYQCLVLK